MIDTHAHIYAEEFDDDIASVVSRAKVAGIKRILMPAIDTETHARMLKLEKDQPGYCLSMMGLHPCSVKANYLDELKVIEQYFSERKFIAVGETGLDFYWDLSFKEQQYEAFHQQAEWALHYDLPLIIHSRNSTNECIEVVQQHQKGRLKGVFHCFSGTAEQARKIVDLGFYLGIGGVLTFKNSGLDKAIADIDLKHIVLETDAPYLAPVPFRGKRNECGYILYVAEKLAELKGVAVEEIDRITTQNANKLFALELVVKTQ
jgi:TatD DNase family protein